MYTLYRYFVLAYIFCPNLNPEHHIHGLWPEFDSRHWPAFCHKEPFSLEGLNMTLMNDRWSTCSNEGNYHFWKHEWDKHGTCTPFNRTEYFNTVLQLDNWLLRNGILEKRCKGSCMIPFTLNFTMNFAVKLR